MQFNSFFIFQYYFEDRRAGLDPLRPSSNSNKLRLKKDLSRPYQPIDVSTDDFETIFTYLKLTYFSKHSKISYYLKKKKESIVEHDFLFSFSSSNSSPDLSPPCILRKIIALVWKGLTIGEEAHAVIIRRHDTCRDRIAIDRFQLQKYLFPQRVSRKRAR